jgi:hypothetical protein
METPNTQKNYEKKEKKIFFLSTESIFGLPTSCYYSSKSWQQIHHLFFNVRTPKQKEQKKKITFTKCAAMRPDPMAPVCVFRHNSLTTRNNTLPANMAAAVMMEAELRRAIPESPCPEAHPPAMRAPNSTRNPPKN